MDEMVRLTNIELAFLPPNTTAILQPIGPMETMQHLRKHYATLGLHYAALRWHNVSFGADNFHCPSGRGAVISHFIHMCHIIPRGEMLASLIAVNPAPENQLSQSPKVTLLLPRHKNGIISH